MKTRFAITKVNSDGLRVLAFANQGRNHHDDPSNAQQALADLLRANSDASLRSLCGDPAKLRVDPIECYDHGDAIRTVLGQDDDLPIPDIKSSAQRL